MLVLRACVGLTANIPEAWHTANHRQGKLEATVGTGYVDIHFLAIVTPNKRLLSELDISIRARDSS
jgi:hypothetical protein